VALDSLQEAHLTIENLGEPLQETLPLVLGKQDLNVVVDQVQEIDEDVLKNAIIAAEYPL